MLQSIVRFALTVLFTWLISKGVVTQDQVSSDLPTIVEVVCLILMTFGGIGWSYLEKLAKGHITLSGQSVVLTPDPTPDNMLSIPRNSVPQPPVPPQPKL
jgi:hypothetical protein